MSKLPLKNSLVAYRAKYCQSMAGEGLVRGSDLLRPLKFEDDRVLLTQGGVILGLEAHRTFRPPAGVTVRDLGEVCLMPALVNAHTHLQLSSLHAHGPHPTLWGQGFVPWLRSLIPLLGVPLQEQDLAAAVDTMQASGIACVGDYTSHGLPAVRAALRARGLDAVHFCECFGFALPADALGQGEAEGSEVGGAGIKAGPKSLRSEQENLSPWPPVVASLVAEQPALRVATLAPAGHAIYSTHPFLLRAALQYCHGQGLPFSLHLAESPEEERALLDGSGPLVDLYAERVLPAGWKAPGLRPVEAAAHWGLLGPDSLAVHGVHCTRQDAHLLAESGTALCLCPRSNQVLGVGSAPVSLLMEAGVSLCLGTDGLTSCPDLNLWQDAQLLHREQDIPLSALVRMLTTNGAQCLKKQYFGSLEAGKSSAFALMPQAWLEDLR